MASIFNNVEAYDIEIGRIDQAIDELEETADSIFYQIPDEKVKEAVIARRDGILNDLKGLKGLFVYQKASLLTDYYDDLLMMNQEQEEEKDEEE